MRRLACLTIAAGLVATAPVFADQASAGRAIAQRNCAACHAIDRTGDSPHRDAPPFRDLAGRYPLEALEEALAEGIDVGHPDMPHFQMTAAQTASFIAYLGTIQERRE